MPIIKKEKDPYSEVLSFLDQANKFFKEFID